MTNTAELKKRLIDLGYDDFQKALSNILNISRQTAGRKLNGEVDFTQSEISVLVLKLKLSWEDVGEIFIRS